MKPAGGFTLLELLTVIGIIALLAAILFPVFASSRERGRRAGCTTQMRQLGVALKLYLQDYDGAAPHFGNPKQLKSGYDPLAPYTKSNGLYQCPSSRYPQHASSYDYQVEKIGWQVPFLMKQGASDSAALMATLLPYNEHNVLLACEAHSSLGCLNELNFGCQEHEDGPLPFLRGDGSAGVTQLSTLRPYYACSGKWVQPKDFHYESCSGHQFGLINLFPSDEPPSGSGIP
jgi:prepilin-type N-terminal cleavage/methylation domain-containing protein